MPQKRKQTPDMPQSPPKRVTRARAKKDVDSKPETTHITTPSAKASTRKKTVAQPAQPAKLKDQSLEEIDADLEPEILREQPDTEPPKTRGKAKATTSTTATKPAQHSTSTAPAKSTRSRAAKAAATASEDALLPKTKASSKRSAGDEALAAQEVVEDAAQEQLPSKKPRGRPTGSATAPRSTRTRATAAAAKKRVKFDDQSEQDKENQPILVDGKKKTIPKATGLRAKPIRKPSTAKGGAKGARATKQAPKSGGDALEGEVLPLSPKKITQVAKTPSVGSEDELAKDKTPLRILSKSPSKIPMSVSRDTNTIPPEEQTEKVEVPESPKKDAPQGRLAISPRKPPPSPYKDALKASPRKFDFGSRPAQPVFDRPLSPSKSPLKESPKRANLGNTSTQPSLQCSRTPMKSSLLHSPARRPGGSSMKTSSFNFSPSKSHATVSIMDTATSTQVDLFKLPDLSIESAASSPLRAAKSPGQPLRVHDSAKEQQLKDRAATPVTSPSKALVINPPECVPQWEADTASFEQEDGRIQEDEVIVSEGPKAQIVLGEQNSFAVEDRSTHACEEVSVIHDEEPYSDMQQFDTAPCNEDTTPLLTGAPKDSLRPAFILPSSMLAERVEESESEDELASPQKVTSRSPLKTIGIIAKDFGTPGSMSPPKGIDLSAKARRASARRSQRDSIAMTPLAMQMSSWLASSPEKKTVSQISHKRGIFSPAKPIFAIQGDHSPGNLAVGSPAKPTFFDDEMAVRESEDVVSVADESSIDELQVTYEEDNGGIEASQESQESETYGDENAVPEASTVYLLEQAEQNHTLTCTPAKVFDHRSRDIHTVSKVPLRPAADDTPLLVPKKRSKSIAGPLCDISLPDRLSISRDSILSPILQDRNLSMSMLPVDATVPETPERPQSGQMMASNTPGRSIRKAGYSSVLKGAVVHVDVHTTEGADASGIFIDLLTQMGARCVKQWHWNPQGSVFDSLGDSPSHRASPEVGTPGGKIGITHVVYKDGGKRTLEKVREAKGAVICVGVGWVLE